MSTEGNEEVSYDYDENAAIEDDECDSVVSEENNKIEKRNILDKSLFKSKSKKIKFTSFCFRKILMLSFIPTVIYNVAWIFILYKIKSDNSDNIDFINYKSKIFFACLFILIKDIFILFIPQIYDDSEKNNINDFSHFRVGVKTLINFGISGFMIYKMNNNLDLDKNFKIFEAKNDINYMINLFYKLEYFYIIGIMSIILLILLIILIIILIELWKAYYRYAIQ